MSAPTTGTAPSEAGELRVLAPPPGANTSASSTTGGVQLLGVTKRFGPTVAVDALDLDVRPGEFLSLLGPSGCGKTTTLRMLAGFEHPDAGEIRVSGQPVTGVPPHKRPVNTVFQAYALFPHLSVAENVAYGLRQRRVGRAEIRAKVADALEMVQMLGFAKRKPAQLSGGQQQRVALARALVNEPAVLLLDEPLGALDRKLREEMQIELKLLQRRLGTTFVFVTHDQSEALSMSDRVAVMLGGRIEQIAEAFEIYENPASAFVAGFIGQQNFRLGTASVDRTVRTPECVFRTSRPGAVPSSGAALAAVRPESVSVTETAPAHQVNAVSGTLAGISHLGDAIGFVVSTPGGEFLARVPRAQAPRLATGTTVWCTWPDDSVHIFDGRQADLVLPARAADDSRASS